MIIDHDKTVAQHPAGATESRKKEICDIVRSFRSAKEKEMDRDDAVLLLAEEKIPALLRPAGLLVVNGGGALLELLLCCLGLVGTGLEDVAGAATADMRGALALTTDNTV